MHLALFVTDDGIHHGGCRHPSASPRRDDFAFYCDLALRTEVAKLDMLFVADKLRVDDIYGEDLATTVCHRSRAAPSRSPCFRRWP
jgi:alkanesulfonate monooxygenase SsuD/methylene tetrahydromethanopterin reductase-like flavin-dependent oxidoreductase (luciferase family)